MAGIADAPVPFPSRLLGHVMGSAVIMAAPPRLSGATPAAASGAAPEREEETGDVAFAGISRRVLPGSPAGTCGADSADGAAEIEAGCMAGWRGGRGSPAAAGPGKHGGAAVNA